ncbi:MAG: helix-turn-helix domain-containing protein [Ornithinibacter sp.]
MTQVARQQFESLSEAAERTGLSIQTLRRRIANGQLAAYRSGPRVLRLDPADVDALMVRVPTMRSGVGGWPPGPDQAPA